MSRSDDIAAAEIAAMVGGHLRTVDANTIERKSIPAAQIDPRQFLTKPTTSRNTTLHSGIPDNMYIDKPSSRPIGSEVVGTQNVNINDLVIPTDGMDEKMREAIKRYSNPELSNMTPPRMNSKPDSPTLGSVIPVPNSVNVNSSILDILTRIEDKLDTLLKRGKIQPRYQKKDKKG